MPGGPELLIVGAVVLLLFGAMTIYLDIFRPIANPFQ